MILGDLNNLPTTKPMKKFSHEAYFSWKDHHKEEAAAFIDEAARVTHKEGGGGCVWPPRSYACSFCKREFKSAQALGGHMNVHRRDRALLKQVININNHSNNISINNDNDPFLPSSSLPLKNNHDYSSISSFKSSRVGQNNNLSHLSVPRKMSSNFSSHQTSSHNNYHVSSTMKVNLRLQSQDAKEVKIRGERSCNDHADDDGCYLSYKRCKKNGDFVTLLPSFLDETIKLSNVKASKSMDDLDLELRLGNPPQKVK